MESLYGFTIIVCLVWWIVSKYVEKWKRDNPGKPAFRWVENEVDSCSLYPDSQSKINAQSDKWLAPGGATSDYYSYHSQRDEDLRRWDEN